MDQKDKDRFSSSSWKYTGVGFELAGSIIIFAMIGYFVDRHWKSSPWGVLIGCLVGIVVGMYLLIKEALMYKDASPKDEFRGPGDDERGKR